MCTTCCLCAAALDLSRRHLSAERSNDRAIPRHRAKKSGLRGSKARLAAIRDFRVLIWQGLRAACILSRVDRHALNTCESARLAISIRWPAPAAHENGVVRDVGISRAKERGVYTFIPARSDGGRFRALGSMGC